MKSNILKTLFIVLCLFTTGKLFAATVKISGKAAGYAQNSINLNAFHDFISEETLKLGTFRFNADGAYELEFDLSKITLSFADFDGYHCMIYLEPGKTYQIEFPPKRTLTVTQKKNPFIKPEPVWFGIKNPAPNDLNILIQQFETAYAKYENQYFDQIFVNRNGSLVDTVKQILNKEFPKTNNPFFEAHKQFRKANLEFALNQGKSETFTEAYFRKTKPEYQLEAYSSLFNEVFINYFGMLENTTRNPEIKKMINNSELQQLDTYFQKQLNFNPELAHWILLKSMKDGYYSSFFTKSSILKMLQQVKELGWSNYEQETAQIIYEKLTYLASGTKPPTLNLQDLTGHTVRFSDYPNTYIYLQFTDPNNPICRQHLDALKSIAERYKNKFVIINVIPTHAKIKTESGWAGIFATTNDDWVKTYKVKTVPNSFLIGKDGKLLLSPAPNPIDGLDRQLGQIFKSDYFKDLQKANNQKIK